MDVLKTYYLTRLMRKEEDDMDEVSTMKTTIHAQYCISDFNNLLSQKLEDYHNYSMCKYTVEFVKWGNNRGYVYLPA